LSEILTFSVDTADRLDRFLAARAGGLSRTRIKSLVGGGHARVDGRPVEDAGLTVRAGQVVELTVPPPAAAEPGGEEIALTIVYEDEDLLVVDKPAGMVVHPAAGNRSGTLVNALIAHCGAGLSGIGGVLRPGIVHRLDKDTSGLMVVAKNDLAHRGLADQFADHGRTGPLERAYLAFAWGVPPQASGIVTTQLDRSSQNREKMAVVAAGRGRRAVTRYSVLRRYGGERHADVASLIECRLETGRTHQIRVHLAHLGHPLLGDATYGAGFKTKAALLFPSARAALERLDRQALHARLLGFEHPRTKQHLVFERPLPAELQRLEQALGKGNAPDA
jgi:23S rRNA pseudouridine1911/1915/1917 synthase